MRLIGVVGSPEENGRTSTAVRAMLGAAASTGTETELLELASTPIPAAIAAIDAADAVVFGSPVYRATYSAALKSLLEQTQRGLHGETTAPLKGTATAIVLTGASEHHFLATDGLRAVLSSFFAAQVLAPALYLDHSHYLDRATLTDPAAELAASHGRALVEMAAAIANSTYLKALEPLI